MDTKEPIELRASGAGPEEDNSSSRSQRRRRLKFYLYNWGVETHGSAPFSPSKSPRTLQSNGSIFVTRQDYSDPDGRSSREEVVPDVLGLVFREHEYSRVIKLIKLKLGHSFPTNGAASEPGQQGHCSSDSDFETLSLL